MIKILGKLHAIMSECDFIAKDKTNDFHKYAYASEQTIKETLHPLLVKYRVFLQIECSTPEFSGNKTTIKPDGTMVEIKGNVTQLPLKYTFWDVESGEYLGGTFTGSGEDQADKGTYKAITGALKYILTSNFLIPTGDDPEAPKSPRKETSQSASRKPIVQPSGITPQCPICKGSMWDNREKKLSPKQPDFKCKDKSCAGVIWPPKPKVEEVNMDDVPVASYEADMPF